MTTGFVNRVMGKEILSSASLTRIGNGAATAGMGGNVTGAQYANFPGTVNSGPAAAMPSVPIYGRSG